MDGLELNKDKIDFTCAPGKKKVVSGLDLTNNSNSRVAYKIKTTFQTRYAVKPNQGIIQPKCNMKVNIMIILSDVSDISTIKDKFQIIYMPVDDSVVEDHLNDVWKINKGKEHSQTLPVVLLSESGERINHQMVSSHGPTMTKKGNESESAFYSQINHPNVSDFRTSNLVSQQESSTMATLGGQNRSSYET